MVNIGTVGPKFKVFSPNLPKTAQGQLLTPFRPKKCPFKHVAVWPWGWPRVISALLGCATKATVMRPSKANTLMGEAAFKIYQ